MITIIWIAMAVTVLGSIELFAATGTRAVIVVPAPSHDLMSSSPWTRSIRSRM